MNKSKHTFFCRDLNFGVLNEEESIHAIRVLRLVEGNIITVIDGAGRQVEAKITSDQKKEVGFEIINEIQHDLHSLAIQIAIAPTKNIDRFSFFLEKVTEMGIREVSPVLCSNSERKELRIDKAKKGLISAIKQSGNLYLPKLNEMVDLKSFITKDFGKAQKFIAHCFDDPNKKKFHQIVNKAENVVILIGPEGDFTLEEINLAQESGFMPVSLGNTRLRTETAGILACHTVYLR